MKRLVLFLSAALIMLCVYTTVSAKEYVNDNAGYLTAAQAQELNSRLEEISNKHNIDAVIVIVEDTDGQSIVSFSDDYFDYNGYGRGDEYNGILMTLSLGPDQRYLSTCGNCIYAFTDEVISYVGSQLAKSANEKDYATTCYKFAEYVDKVMTAYYDKGKFKPPVSLTSTNMAIVLIVALIMAFVIAGMVKSGMNTAITPIDADIYAKADSINITASRDMFLYTHITKTERKNESSRGGSSTHTSSSGRSHGGGSF